MQRKPRPTLNELGHFIALCQQGATMNTNLKSSRRVASRRIASALLLSVALARGASAQTVTAPELAQKMKAARTPSDCEALAAYYGQQAAADRAFAKEHRKMAKSYQGMVGGGRGGASMPAHCNAIVGKSESLAKEYDGMAAAYWQLADQAQPWVSDDDHGPEACRVDVKA
jgi:hypothetical protein